MFMTSCLTGSTTDPVIRKRTISVAITMIATAIGRCSSRLAWKSRKFAVAPVTSTSAPLGASISRTARTVSRLASSMYGLLRDRLDHGQVRRQPSAAG